MQCCQCHKELPDGVIFCKYCGAKQNFQQAEVGEKKTSPDVAGQRSDQVMKSTKVKTEKTESKLADKVEKVGAFPKTPEKETIELHQVGIVSEVSSSPVEKEDSIFSDELKNAVENEAPHPSEPTEVEEVPEALLEEKSSMEAVNLPEQEPKAQSVPPVTENVYQDVPEEILAAKQPDQEESKEELVFDIDQIMSSISPAGSKAAATAAEEVEPDIELENQLLFDLDHIAPPEVSTAPPNEANLKADHETVREEALNQAEPIREQTECALVAEKQQSENTNISGHEVEPEAVKPVVEQEIQEAKAEHIEKNTVAEEPLVVREEKKPAQTVQRFRNDTVSSENKFSQITSNESGKEPSVAAVKQAKKSVKPVLWRLVVIAVELGVIAYLSYQLFF